MWRTVPLQSNASRDEIYGSLRYLDQLAWEKLLQIFVDTIGKAEV
jgi:hypothetical protein